MTTVDNVEKALLGMRLLNLDSIDDVLKERVNVGMFADLSHIALWSLCNVLEKELGRLDATVLAANLDRLAPEDRATIDEDYVLDLIHWAPAAADVVVDTYIQALEDSYTKRMMEATHARVGQLLGANETPENILHEVRSLWGNIGEVYRRAGTQGDALLGAFTSWLDGEDGFYATPWEQINRLIDGWRPGGLYVAGARPGGFKSAIALQAALGVAVEKPVAISSLEMSCQEVMSRLVSVRLRAPYRHVIAGGLTQAQRDDAVKAATEIAALPISVDDRSGVTIDDVRAHARAVKHQHGDLGMIVVDYLQLMSSPRGDRRPRHEIVADFSRQLKIMAGDLECPVLALSQLNRMAAEGSGPSMAHLRESGALEQDANVIMLLSCPEGSDGQPNKEVLDIKVAKNRQGPTGGCRLNRARDSMAFED